MRGEERKYADLGKFEKLFEVLEQEIGKNTERTSINKESAYDYIRRSLRRMDADLPRTRNYVNFMEEAEMLVRSSRRDSGERDENFSKEIMDKLKNEFQEAVPNGDYESVDMNKFMGIAQQMIKTFEKELKGKEIVEVEHGVEVPNGYFVKLQNEFEQKARSMLTIEEREEAVGYIRRMCEGTEELVMIENDGIQTTLANVTQIFNRYIMMQKQIEEDINLSAETELKEVEENEKSPFDFDEVPQIQEETMEKIASEIPVQPVIKDENMESIAPESHEKDEKDDLPYEVIKQPQYDDTGKLIARGSAKTRSVGKLEDLAPGERYVTIHNKDFDLTCTAEEAIKMLENDRAIAKNKAKEKISEMFL